MQMAARAPPADLIIFKSEGLSFPVTPGKDVITFSSIKAANKR
jgi:hypothetical protein